jgi:formylglycine-generating enzyme required for sulfatase activity
MKHIVGNVWEWTADWWSNKFSNQAAIDPVFELKNFDFVK